MFFFITVLLIRYKNSIQNTELGKLIICKTREVIGDGDEDKNYNRIQTGRRGCGWGWGHYSRNVVGWGRCWEWE